MKGSLAAITSANGTFTPDNIHHTAHAHEALKECFNIINYLGLKYAEGRQTAEDVITLACVNLSYEDPYDTPAPPKNLGDHYDQVAKEAWGLPPNQTTGEEMIARAELKLNSTPIPTPTLNDRQLDNILAVLGRYFSYTGPTNYVIERRRELTNQAALHEIVVIVEGSQHDY